MKKVGENAQSLTPDTARIPVIRQKLENLMAKYPNFTPEQLNTINVPFLVIAGDHDMISLDHTVLLYRNLPMAQLFIVPHASHLVPLRILISSTEK